jgi:hypothetical protein
MFLRAARKHGSAKHPFGLPTKNNYYAFVGRFEHSSRVVINRVFYPEFLVAQQQDRLLVS